MPCCVAVNCCNRSEKGFRLFRYPTNDPRRLKWIHNTRRGNNWQPTKSSYLCEKHFEESQFENNREDGWKKLRPDAIPTLFTVPNPPPMINPPPRKSLYKTLGCSTQPSHNDSCSQEARMGVVLDGNISQNEAEDELTKLRREVDSLRKQLESANAVIETLKKENRKLRSDVDQRNDMFSSFLNRDQIKMLESGRLSQWANDSIIKGLKFRFALSVHGYKFLRSTGYPLPSYSTLMRKIQDVKLTFGIFSDVIDLLKFKVESMCESDRFCVLSYDEMVVSEQLDFDKNLGKFTGFVTLGDKIDVLGQKIFTVVVRGIKNRWKQVIACHITHKQHIDPEVLKRFMLECITSVENCGLHVLALSSDLDGRNRSLWATLNINIAKFGVRNNSFTFNEHEIFAIPDACHLLKNLKAAVLRQIIYLPTSYTEVEELPSNEVDGSYVKQLWDHEIAHGFEKRLLHHIRQADVEPSNFDKMNVGAAVRFFSAKTASALQTAVANGILPTKALTTSHFILIIEKWFSIISSKVRKTSITSRNCDQKYIFLHMIIDLFQRCVFKEGWKPLNYGFVLCTLSFCDMVEFLFQNKYDFVLGHRFTQDVTENVFSQIRNKEGSMPSAQKALRAIRNITVAQYVSNVKRTNYFNDSDEFLLNFCETKKKSLQTSGTPENMAHSRSVHSSSSAVEFDVKTLSFESFGELFSNYDANSTFFIAGSTTKALVPHVCPQCVDFLSLKNLPESVYIQKAKAYTKGADKGGLREPCFETLNLILHCEYYYKIYRDHILRNENSTLIQCLVKNVNIVFPLCCEVKEKIVKHYFTVRSFCVKNFSENSKKRKTVFGTASAKRTKN